jgi:hypothetical protein
MAPTDFHVHTCKQYLTHVLPQYPLSGGMRWAPEGNTDSIYKVRHANSHHLHKQKTAEHTLNAFCIFFSML